MKLRSILGHAASALLMFTLAACGGGGSSTPATFTVGGTASGLVAGKQVTLKNGTESLVVSANSAFTFVTAVALNGSYAVTVGTQPTGETCTVGNGSGTGVTANVTNITLACSSQTFTVAGTVSGLGASQQVTLANNGADPLVVNANGAFAFALPVAFSGNYAVTVTTQPAGQTCTVSAGSGAGVVANVTGVSITCSNQTYTIGGTVSGLAAGQQLTVNNNGADALVITGNAAYKFATPVAVNGSYAVTIATQPAGQTCSVANPQGAGVNANITNADITCSTTTYTIGGTISGLAAGQQVTLVNNGDTAGAFTATANGAYAFGVPVPFNGSFAVTVNAQPTGQTCTVTGGAGNGVTANITNAMVICATNTFPVSGTVSGLPSGTVTLLDNGLVSDPQTVGNGAFAFATQVAYGANAAVTVSSMPTGVGCTVTGGSVTHVTAPVTGVAVVCSTNTFTVGVSVSGLTTGQQVTLNNNSADPLTFTAAGAATANFSTPVAFGSSYAVTVGTQPTAEGCRVQAGTGTNVMANVTNVTVTCRPEIAYVVNEGLGTVSNPGSVSQYTIGSDGSLIPMATVAVVSGTTVNSQPREIATDPSGSYAYVTNYGEGTVSQFTINADGSLTAMTVATITIGTGGTTSGPTAITIDPAGQHVYVVATGDHTVSQFAIGSGGALAPMSPPTVATGDGPLSITLDPQGRYAYVSNFYDAGSTISEYTIGSDGSLNALATLSIGTGLQPYGITIDPAGQFAYVGNYGTYAKLANPMAAPVAGSILQFTIGPDGSLSHTTGAVAVPAGDGPYPLVINSTDVYGFFVNYYDNTLEQCSITSGTLACAVSPASAGAALDFPEGTNIDPSGRYLYVTNQGSGIVNQFSITGSTTPTLSGIGSGTQSAGFNPVFITTIR